MKDRARVRAAAQLLVYSLECAFDTMKEITWLESLETEKKGLIARIVIAEEKLKSFQGKRCRHC